MNNQRNQAVLVKAQQARNLANDPTYVTIMEEVRSRQTSVFLNASASIEDIAEAHSIIRAMEKVDQCIRSLENAAVVELKKPK